MKLQVYPDTPTSWRWRAITNRGTWIAISPRHYPTRSSARESAMLFKKQIARAAITTEGAG